MYMYIPDEGIVFELNPGPHKDDEGRPLLYAIPEKGRKFSFASVARDAVDRHLALSGEMERTFNAFFETAGMMLSRGYRVVTPIGSFAPKLRMKGDFTDPDAVKGSDVEFAGIDFRPSRDFLKRVDSNPHPCKKKQQLVGNSLAADSRSADEALRRSLAKGYTTVRSFMLYSGLKRDSARKLLDGLCDGEEPLLEKRREGRTAVYSYAKPQEPAK